VFETLRNAWKVGDLRKKLLYTLFMIIIFRIGSAITVPFLDIDAVGTWMKDTAKDGNFLEYMNVMTGGALSKATIFALSITPYINASIIMQLLTYALPPLERLQQEGEEGRKKINKITAVVALALAAFMSIAYYFTLKNSMKAVRAGSGSVDAGTFAPFKTWENWFIGAIIVVSFMAGASLVIWMGNRINDKGIGNGVSMLLFAGIAARFPTDVGMLAGLTKNNPSKYLFVSIGVALFFVLMIGFVVFMNESERRITIQYAKRVVGRKQYGGQKSHIPIKICMSGVMPIIFAMSFMSLPTTIQMFKPLTPGVTSGFYYYFCHFFSTRSYSYAAIYFLLIIGFNYFYVSMQYNPVEIANNLRTSNGGIPGIRPGKPTSDYIKRILSKLTLVGAFFLGVIAIVPIFASIFDKNLASLSMGGTSLLIVVSVALETTRTLESQMMMRHHKGFLK